MFKSILTKFKTDGAMGYNRHATMKRKLFFGVLVVLFIPVFAQEVPSDAYIKYKAIQINGVYYNLLSDGTAEVTNARGGDSDGENCYAGKIIILPSVSYSGTNYNVTKIGKYAFYYCKYLDEVIIHNRIRRIGYGAFAGSKIYSIKLPESIKVIDKYAFNQSKICEMIIPESVDTIGDYAFLNCENLSSVNLPQNVAYVGLWAFAGTSIFKPVYNSHIFAYLPPSFSEYAIPDGIKVIAGGAFSCCTGLTKLKIPISVKTIGEYACAGYHGYNIPGCHSLNEVCISDGVIEVKMYAFYGCSSLEKVIIGNNVEKLCERCFANCKNLKTITFGKKLKYIGKSVFGACEKLESVNLPQGLVQIEAYAFSGCRSLIYLTIPSSVNKIGSNAFYGMPYIVYSGNASGAPWGANAVCQ